MKIRNIFRRSKRPASGSAAPRSPIEMYAAGGGNLNAASPGVMALLWEAERGHHRGRGHDRAPQRPARERLEPGGPLHAHEVTPADAAMMRMMAGASFGPNAVVQLPSGRTVTGDEMQKWVDAN